MRTVTNENWCVGSSITHKNGLISITLQPFRFIGMKYLRGEMYGRELVTSSYDEATRWSEVNMLEHGYTKEYHRNCVKFETNVYFRRHTQVAFHDCDRELHYMVGISRAAYNMTKKGYTPEQIISILRKQDHPLSVNRNMQRILDSIAQAKK